MREMKEIKWGGNEKDGGKEGDRRRKLGKNNRKETKISREREKMIQVRR